jgi:hypothetical protein
LLGIAMIGAVLAWSATAPAQGPTGVIASTLVHITVYVDTTYCATAGVQCTGTGHTASAAGQPNHNPVRVIIQVAVDMDGNGVFTPLDGLTSSAFVIRNQFFPAGGPSLERLSCAECFQAAAGGTYSIFVHPTSGNWDAGSYFLQIRFEAGDLVLFPVIARIDIPF